QPVPAGRTGEELLPGGRPFGVVHVERERPLELRANTRRKPPCCEHPWPNCGVRHQVVSAQDGQRSTISASGSCAGSAAGSTSLAHSRVFQAGTGVLHSDFGTKRDRWTSRYWWM